MRMGGKALIYINYDRMSPCPNDRGKNQSRASGHAHIHWGLNSNW